MVEAIAEKQLCAKCGVDVRENTAFCYNCGESVLLSVDDVTLASETANDVDGRTKAALDELAEKFKIDPEEDDRLAKAAAERRQARVSNRKRTRYEWQPTDDAPNFVFILLTAVIVGLAALVVALTVLWK